MSRLPKRCVVDTNVPMTANNANPEAGIDCVKNSAVALYATMKEGRVFIDDHGFIIEEYRKNLRARGEPGPGDAFFKWLLDHLGSGKVTQVQITPKDNASDEFMELPDAPEEVFFDPSDRKFLAVAAAHSEHPPILQSFDSKWWGWQDALEGIGVRIHFLCEEAIKKKYREKMGDR